MEGFLSQFGYVAILVALTLGGLGVPVPEELTQLTAGALAHEGILDVRLAIPVVWAGILIGDTILFMLARRHGPRLLETRAARRVLTPDRRRRLETHFARHAFWTVVVARHAGGVRFAAFALAGASGVRPSTFILADAISALVSVPIVVGAGWVFWEHLSQARKGVRLVELVILAVVAVAVGVTVLVRRRARAPA
jgi:membrane protein DedA with SNARE-associated domain